MKVKNHIPAVGWLARYDKTLLRGDLVAGLTVGVMLIPQGMAYAMIAGLPPIYGLYASTIPLIIYALFGTSRQLAVGPVAMVSLLTAAGIGAISDLGSETYISLAIALALLVGTLQFLLGVFRLGFLVNFLSHPVVSGFTSAAALIIGLGQLKHLMGIDIRRGQKVYEILMEAVQKIGDVHLLTFAMGAGGIVLILALKIISKRIPGLLLTVVLAVLLVWSLGLDELGVKIVGAVPLGLPAVIVPSFDLPILQVLLPTALAIALVSFMESIAVAKAVQLKHKNYQIEPNQELIALGLANLGGAFFQSYPVTGGFSRTAVNDQAGANTGMASIFSAILIILTLLFLTPLFFYLPNAILASVIMVAVFNLIDLKEAIHLWSANRSDFWMLIVTFISTLTLGIEQGIGIGVILSLAIIIFRTTRPHVAELGQVPDTDFYRNIDRFEEIRAREDLLILRFDAQLYFANINYFRERLENIVSSKGDALRAIIINAESINNIDSTAMHALIDLIADLSASGLHVYFSGVKGPVRDAMVRGSLLETVGEERFFLSVQNAVDHHDRVSNQSKEHQTFTFQSNVED
ncbi:MAG: solute carrier family 26 protein [Saprospiraceae bacterium]|nr:solute carrier family 26 protein [Saprospiraceae bacterium]